MCPPICELYHKKFDPGKGGYSLKTADGRAFHNKFKEEGITDHPPDTGWFCGDHYEEAEKKKSNIGRCFTEYVLTLNVPF